MVVRGLGVSVFWLPLNVALASLASHADILRLVTRSSPRGEERVTSLRTSAWEAIASQDGMLVHVLDLLVFILQH